MAFKLVLAVIVVRIFKKEEETRTCTTLPKSLDAPPPINKVTP
jgi:hypothetical protein